MSTSDPYAAKGQPALPNPVLPAPGHPPVPRLVAAGATSAEVTEAQRRWAEMSERERWESTEAMNMMTEDDLREQLEEGRAESAAVPALGERAPEGTVAEVRRWIGSDSARARLALDAEHTRDRFRAGVVDYADEILGK